MALPRELGRHAASLIYGATTAAAALHGLVPAVLIAATRNQYFVPLVNPVTTAFAFVQTAAVCQECGAFGAPKI